MNRRRSSRGDDADHNARFEYAGQTFGCLIATSPRPKRRKSLSRRQSPATARIDVSDAGQASVAVGLR
jgi:hypothetical protein